MTYDQKVKTSAMKSGGLYSIGHSNHAIDHFINLLQQHQVDLLVDVRSAPYSRFNPQYNKNNLAGSLKAAGIEYLFFGKELGARVEDPSCYIEGKVQYSRLAARQEFKDAITRLIRQATEQRLALMCAEKEPLDCHRTILVSPALSRLGHEVKHILADGSIEAHDQTLKRLMLLTGVPEDDMFMTEDEKIQTALSEQETKIAYRLNPI